MNFYCWDCVCWIALFPRQSSLNVLYFALINPLPFLVFFFLLNMPHTNNTTFVCLVFFTVWMNPVQLKQMIALGNPRWCNLGRMLKTWQFSIWSLKPNVLANRKMKNVLECHWIKRDVTEKQPSPPLDSASFYWMC